jgi:DsbC/DsbD-like thiol-disulfide interchange protein
LKPVAADGVSFGVFDSIASSVASPQAIGIERSRASQSVESSRAAVIDLKTGKVLSVVATAGKDRFIQSVSGGAAGILYETKGTGGRKVYWREPGAAHGSPMLGLPADLTALVAQA